MRWDALRLDTAPDHQAAGAPNQAAGAPALFERAAIARTFDTPGIGLGATDWLAARASHAGDGGGDQA